MASERKVNGIYGETVETMIITDEWMLEKGLEMLWSRVKEKGTKRVIGLALTNVFRPTYDGGNRVAVLNLCSGCFCLVVHLIHFSTIPSCLTALLDLPDVTFAGIGIEKTMKLRADFEIECRNAVELGSFAAAVRGKPALSGFGLLDLVEYILEFDINEKPAGLVFSDWGSTSLTGAQIRHSVIDAYSSFVLANNLLVVEDDSD